MKADAPKRRIFNDAVDLLSTEEQPPSGSGVEMLDIDAIKPFRHHPFHLYEGERLNDMVESIKEHGILNPVIVRKMHYGYEMLSGHNRQNAAKLAGLKQIPAFVKDNLPDEEAYVYVIETNLMQRSFTDLSISEKAAVLAERYDRVLYQRKRDEIVAELKALEGSSDTETEKGGHDVHLSKNRDNLGDEYGLSGRHVARLMRVNQCLPEIKEMLDQGKMQLTAAVQLSYLPEQGQRMALEVSEKSGTNITEKIAKEIRNVKMTEKDIREAIAGPDPEINKLTGEPIQAEEKPKPIRLSGDIRAKYFSDTPQKEVEDIIDKALAAWFKKRR
ncbi:MAG: ParB/RepB/Spo0J family partition protein [Lachnospiraceae bacterium]|nr:ParB/RepB/Spo0J family partition protein [Lachnospiraceae bacterium]